MKNPDHVRGIISSIKKDGVNKLQVPLLLQEVLHCSDYLGEEGGVTSCLVSAAPGSCKVCPRMSEYLVFF